MVLRYPVGRSVRDKLGVGCSAVDCSWGSIVVIMGGIGLFHVIFKRKFCALYCTVLYCIILRKRQDIA